MLPKFLAYLVILCFERRCLKQNTVARLKLSDLVHPKILCWLRNCYQVNQLFYFTVSAYDRPFFLSLSLYGLSHRVG